MILHILFGQAALEESFESLLWAARDRKMWKDMIIYFLRLRAAIEERFENLLAASDIKMCRDMITHFLWDHAALEEWFKCLLRATKEMKMWRDTITLILSEHGIQTRGIQLFRHEIGLCVQIQILCADPSGMPFLIPYLVYFGILS